METTFGPQSLKYSSLWPFTEKKKKNLLSFSLKNDWFYELFQVKILIKYNI